MRQLFESNSLPVRGIAGIYDLVQTDEVKD